MQIKSKDLNRYALTISAAALLAGCGGSQPPISAPGAMAQSPAIATLAERGGSWMLPGAKGRKLLYIGGIAQRSYQRNAASETVIYSFGSKTPDGYNPQQTLTDVHGTLYGETENDTAHRDRGTIFTVTTSGSETVLHKVTGKQGQFVSQLILGPRPTGEGLALYGTGEFGGANGYGTVVRVGQSGSVSVLHSFAGGADGASPVAGLVNVNGTFYGTTIEGGNGCASSGCGTVFSVTPSGTESVIYAFHGGTEDGSAPMASLANVNGALYGTTEFGGTYNAGTVFSVTTSGAEHVIYNFKGGSSDGSYPVAGVIAVNGTLYGTTGYGGLASNCHPYGCGTVFSLTPSGTETVLHYFPGGTGGEHPTATLLELNGKMYGTTCGGAYGSVGTVFSITPSGTEKILAAFVDGEVPYGGLINVHRTLYGTTEAGGTHNDGTVYSITL